MFPSVLLLRLTLRDNITCDVLSRRYTTPDVLTTPRTCQSDVRSLHFALLNLQTSCLLTFIPETHTPELHSIRMSRWINVFPSYDAKAIFSPPMRTTTSEHVTRDANLRQRNHTEKVPKSGRQTGALQQTNNPTSTTPPGLRVARSSCESHPSPEWSRGGRRRPRDGFRTNRSGRRVATAPAHFSS